MNELKMTTSDNASSSIVVSFESKWEEPLRTQEVSVVFRKRGPRNFIPDFIYVYVGSPLSSLIGRLPVNNCEQLPVAKALKLADAGAISSEALRSYSGDYESLYVFSVGDFEEVSNVLTYSELAHDFGFSPPQSFFVLSKSGKTTLDKKSKLAN